MGHLLSISPEEVGMFELSKAVELVCVPELEEHLPGLVKSQSAFFVGSRWIIGQELNAHREVFLLVTEK